MTIRELLAHPKVKGVCIGCCVKTRAALDEFGHAHLEGDPNAGFICLRSVAELRRGILDLPAAGTSLHELAHLISNQQRGQVFHQVARELGISREAREYHPAYKRRRKR